MVAMRRLTEPQSVGRRHNPDRRTRILSSSKACQTKSPASVTGGACRWLAPERLPIIASIVQISCAVGNSSRPCRCSRSFAHGAHCGRSRTEPPRIVPVAAVTCRKDEDVVPAGLPHDDEAQPRARAPSRHSRCNHRRSLGQVLPAFAERPQPLVRLVDRSRRCPLSRRPFCPPNPFGFPARVCDFAASAQAEGPNAADHPAANVQSKRGILTRN